MFYVYKRFVVCIFKNVSNVTNPNAKHIFIYRSLSLPTSTTMIYVYLFIFVFACVYEKGHLVSYIFTLYDSRQPIYVCVFFL